MQGSSVEELLSQIQSPLRTALLVWMGQYSGPSVTTEDSFPDSPWIPNPTDLQMEASEDLSDITGSAFWLCLGDVLRPGRIIRGVCLCVCAELPITSPRGHFLAFLQLGPRAGNKCQSNGVSMVA